MNRRRFLQAVGVAALGTQALAANPEAGASARKAPNLLVVLGDQWRAQATGYAGDPNVKTPHLDAFAARSTNFRNAVSCCPVCSPYRASLLTGRYPLSHGIFMNDVHLPDSEITIAEVLADAGYATGYIGKWHLDGHGRSAQIPAERRQGFEFWRVLECTHSYNDSAYYGDGDEKLHWEGYDAIAQTCEAGRYLRERDTAKPFALFLSWGPPHNPYETAPEAYRNHYTPESVTLRPNVPEEAADAARRDLAGYYAHCAALDDCMQSLLDTLDEQGLAEDTIVVFSSDHGDMLGSHAQMRKQRPWDESIRIPFLLRYPRALGETGRVLDTPINAPDVMPTLLGLCGIAAPAAVQGRDWSPLLLGQVPDSTEEAALISCYVPFGEWIRGKGGKEYRGVRTPRYTYVRDLEGPWLLFDNETDPYQLANLCGQAEHAEVQNKLEAALQEKLRETGDAFLPGDVYVKQWGYPTDKTGTVPYAP